MKKLFYILITLTVITGHKAFTQDSALLTPDYKRNTIKWNMTPFLIWDYSNINFSYERILSPYKSFSVNAGYFTLPSTGIYDSLNISSENKKLGFTFSGDYRWYFKKRNKNFAPDGLYWGTYGSFHYYEFTNDITVINSDLAQGSVTLNGRLNIISAGVELGYQFAVGKRWTFDLVFMGPSLSLYSGKFTLGGNLTVDEESEYLQAIYDIFVGKFPGLKTLITEGNFSPGGTATSIGYGMRYLIQVGYRF
jgi:hypothetical protein